MQLDEEIEYLEDLIGSDSFERLSIMQGVSALVDDDGLRKQLKPLCKIGGATIVGPAVFVRSDYAGEIVSLTDNDIALFQEHIVPCP